MIDSGRLTPAMSVARQLRRNSSTTRTRAPVGDDERELHILDRGADRLRAVVHDVERHARGQRAA